MPKYKLSKSDEQWLRNEAKKLPPDYSATVMKTTITGEKAALSGLKKTSNTGEAIDPKQLYVSKIPNVIPVNHFRRMKKLYEDGEWPAVNKYLDKYRIEADKIFPTAPKEPEPEKPKSILQKIRSKFH